MWLHSGENRVNNNDFRPDDGINLPYVSSTESSWWETLSSMYAPVTSKNLLDFVNCSMTIFIKACLMLDFVTVSSELVVTFFLYVIKYV